MAEDLLFTEGNVERLYKAMTQELCFDPLEEPKVAVWTIKDGENTDGHIVDIEDWTCTCPDSQYNVGAGEMCKHRWFILLKRAGLL